MQNGILITDIGSTTTKAVLFTLSGSEYTLAAMHDVPTTVEKPAEDVRVGVFNAISGLQEKSGRILLSPGSTPEQIRLDPEVLYLSTSSAGGGLQILVVGLTVFDSAASAQRVAYGAGGVLLDTFAIDDRRSAVEQMQDMNCLQPDIVLFSGGVDGGAISGLVRLGEILSLARPRPKYGEHRKIPLVFAGNRDAIPLVEGLFANLFELHVTPNLRPSMTGENPGPARDEIRRLFMENVMERAPGYAGLKTSVGGPVIPTPTGVMQSLTLLGGRLGRQLLAVDIGGATTDVFSNILDGLYRTVSANLGMSYNLCEVLAAAGERVGDYLPAGFDPSVVRDYAGNKVLQPTRLPGSDQALAIEHALARQALFLAREEHLRMNFNVQQVGYLDRLMSSVRDLSEKMYDTFYLEQTHECRRFYMRDFDLVIGAGGVISHAPHPGQAAMMLIDGMAPQGVTELWRDPHFITPHLGKLADQDPELALDLLTRFAFEPLGFHVRPAYRRHRKPKQAMRVEIPGEPDMILQTGDFRHVPRSSAARKIVFHLEPGVYLQDDANTHTLETDQPLFLDLRESPDFEKVNRELGLWTFDTPPALPKHVEHGGVAGTLTREVRLPYQGDVRVQLNQTVQPDTLVGENPFDPPRIYVLSLFTVTSLPLTPEILRHALKIRKGDEVYPGQKILDTSGITSRIAGYSYQAPVRGRVEDINFESGVVVLREIQDYSDKPVKVNVAEALGLPPRHIRGYLKKRKGDFVYAGEYLAQRVLDQAQNKVPTLVAAPSTGSIVDIDFQTGILTIQYQLKPYRRFALVPGKVVSVEDGFGAVIEFSGEERSGAIGFGSEGAGRLLVAERPDLRDSALRGAVLVVPGPVSRTLLDALAGSGIAGLVAASVHQGELVEYLGYEIGAAITGKEKIPFPIVLTEGFGQVPMASDTVAFLTARAGRHAFIEGRTQIRAGVVRPRIVIVEDRL